MLQISNLQMPHFQTIQGVGVMSLYDVSVEIRSDENAKQFFNV